MIIEILKEAFCACLLVLIVAVGTIAITVVADEIAWQKRYANWEYNLNPDSGSGWIDSVVRPD